MKNTIAERVSNLENLLASRSNEFHSRIEELECLFQKIRELEAAVFVHALSNEENMGG